MKNSIPLLFVFIALTTIQCSNEFETIRLFSNTYIDLPQDFVLEESNSPSSDKLYEANNGIDELHILVNSYENMDTLTLEQRKDMLNSNLDGFVKSFISKNVIKNRVKTRGDLIQNEYSMEVEIGDTAQAVFVTAVNRNSTILIVAYFTQIPIKESNVELKTKIFKSIKID